MFLQQLTRRIILIIRKQGFFFYFKGDVNDFKFEETTQTLMIN